MDITFYLMMAQIICLLINMALILLIRHDNKNFFSSKKILYHIRLMEKNRNTLLEHFKDNQELTTIVREIYSDNINALKSMLNLEDKKWNE